MDLSPVNTAVRYLDFAGAQTLEELTQAVSERLFPEVSPGHQKYLRLAQEQLTLASERLAEAVVAWGEAIDGGSSVRAETLRAYIREHQHALGMYVHIVAVSANDVDMFGRAEEIRQDTDRYIEALEAALDATAAASRCEVPATTTVH